MYGISASFLPFVAVLQSALLVQCFTAKLLLKCALDYQFGHLPKQLLKSIFAQVVHIASALDAEIHCKTRIPCLCEQAATSCAKDPRATMHKS